MRLVCVFSQSLAEIRFRDDAAVSVEGWDTTVAILGVCAVGVVVFAVGAPMLAAVLRTRSREKTKREIAAYVAEGSIGPEDGARLLEAGAARSEVRSVRDGHARRAHKDIH